LAVDVDRKVSKPVSNRMKHPRNGTQARYVPVRLHLYVRSVLALWELSPKSVRRLGVTRRRSADPVAECRSHGM
jgi:hypothetical protein